MKTEFNEAYLYYNILPLLILLGWDWSG